MRRSYWLLAIGGWLAPVAASATHDSTATEGTVATSVLPARPSALRPWWIGAWAAAANRSAFETRHGERYRDLRMVGLRVGRELRASAHISLDYFVDVVPFVQSTNNPVRYTVGGCSSVPPMPCGTSAVMETSTARGYALTPIGLQLRAFTQKPVQLVFGVALGTVWYDQPVPDPDEKRLNFMGDVSAGIQVRLGRSGALLAGVRHNHTSNAGTGPVNPGLDSRALYVGATRTLGRRARQ